jgi:hypothetical protein
MFGNFFAKKKKRREAVADVSFVSHGIYSEMNYCPACGDEYRADQTTCAACDRELISGTQKLALIREKEKQRSGRSMEISVDDELVTLRKGALKDIKQLQYLLAKDRIPAMLAGDEQSCGKGCCGPEMYLQVRKSDAESAMAVLNEDFIKSTALSNHDMTHTDAVYVQGAEANVCPACGCQFSPYVENNCPECGLCFG